MILGGLIGFLIGMGFGFAGQNDWVSILLKACTAAYLAGLMMRWWARMWVRCLRDAFMNASLKQRTHMRAHHRIINPAKYAAVHAFKRILTQSFWPAKPNPIPIRNPINPPSIIIFFIRSQFDPQTLKQMPCQCVFCSC